jgi:hypothetical protein
MTTGIGFVHPVGFLVEEFRGLTRDIVYSLLNTNLQRQP